MQMNITARHDAKASDGIRERILAKLQKNVSHFDHITKIQVTIDKDNKQDMAEATLHLDTGNEIFAKATGDNMYSAIDSLSAKIETQLQKAKSKIQSRKGFAAQGKRTVVEESEEVA
ncbi:MAG: ribosome-associated translation inhibitor RaiA [Gammaproteobacteria bacterium]|jgi:ribosomal subunit interface protein|nr:ribosome-associated translation inhibitor RaiA [Gammaproteobacteria bacterium]MCP4879038.1 ribosome-associated translation inhibitor RaiA [Gammaproteobacteria bacterium]MDP6165380.1 ribosome-associated translation inhibitor RaiA [Gammaproteobacteria bacterium]